MNAIIFGQSGHLPTSANLYVLVYSMLNIICPIAIVLILVWYFIKQIRYREQLLIKLDSLIELLQHKNTCDK